MGFWHIAHYLTLLSGNRKHFRAFGSVQLESLFWCTTVCRAEMCCVSLYTKCFLHLAVEGGGEKDFHSALVLLLEGLGMKYGVFQDAWTMRSRDVLDDLFYKFTWVHSSIFVVSSDMWEDNQCSWLGKIQFAERCGRIFDLWFGRSLRLLDVWIKEMYFQWVVQNRNFKNISWLGSQEKLNVNVS